MTESFEQEVNEMCDIGHGIAKKNYDKGKIELLISMIKDKILSLAEAAKRMNMSEEVFKQNVLNFGFKL